MLRSAWAAICRALSAFDTMLGYLLALMFFGLGGYMLYLAMFEEVPTPEQMVGVSGYVHRYNIEHSRSGRPDQVNFELWNDDTPYWTDEIDTRWVEGNFDGQRIFIAFHIEPGPVYRMGTVKTFGLAVNGRVIERMEDDLRVDAALLRYVFPVLALVMFAVAFWKWPRKPAESLETHNGRQA